MTSLFSRHAELVRSVCRNDLPAVQAVIEADVDAINKKDHYGWTPLMYAASRGYLDIMQALIDAGADLKIRNDNGQTALDIARQLEGHTILPNEPALPLKAALDNPWSFLKEEWNEVVAAKPSVAIKTGPQRDGMPEVADLLEAVMAKQAPAAPPKKPATQTLTA